MRRASGIHLHVDGQLKSEGKGSEELSVQQPEGLLENLLPSLLLLNSPLSSALN